jgi:hypothetical protein
MTVKEFLEKSFKEDGYNVRSRAVCEDGFSVSIQGGTEFHYCTPRKLCNEYETVELGFPTAIENSLLPYAEDINNPCDTVYGYVPIKIVEEVIKKHGGIK